MLHWTLLFLVLALVAGLLGFSGLMGGFAWLAKLCFGVFLILLVVSLLTGKRPVT